MGLFEIVCGEFIDPRANWSLACSTGVRMVYRLFDPQSG